MKRQWLKGSSLNLLGTGIPFIFAIICMPVLLHKLGTEKFGLLILAWTVIGYLTIFDFGLGRAITQAVAQAYKVHIKEATHILTTGILVLICLGIFGGVIVYFAAPGITHFARMPMELKNETIRAIRILGIGLPLVILSAGLRGALEAAFDFTGANLVRLMSGVGTYLVPVLILPYSVRLDWICTGLVLLRALTCLGFYMRCRSRFELGNERFYIDRNVARKILNYGGWVTTSNLISPIMAYLDRFLIAGIISVSMVGYYSTSQEVVTKFQIIPGAILSVFFPAFSRNFESSPAHAGRLFVKGANIVAFLLLPLATGCVLFAKEGLGLWFGQDFANHAYLIAKILTIGSFINCLALNPFSFLQGIGRPDITAKIHMLELPIYVTLLWFLIAKLGIIGVAIAWALRMLIDLAALLWMVSRQLNLIDGFKYRVVFPFLGLTILLILFSFLTPLPYRALGLLAVVSFSVWRLWAEWREGDINLLEAGS